MFHTKLFKNNFQSLCLGLKVNWEVVWWGKRKEENDYLVLDTFGQGKGKKGIL